MTQQPSSEFGRADDNGNVYVVRDGAEVLVGQYPDATPSEALAFFVRKFTDIESQVILLEQRLIRGADSRALRQGLAAVRKSLTETTGVGDYAALTARVETLSERIDSANEKQQLQNAQAIETATAERQAIAEAAEKLAGADPEKTQWKKASAEFEALFEKWQAHQKSSPKLPRQTADEIWGRFKTARSHFESNRRAFFAQLDSQHKEARAAKKSLIEAAQALSPDDRNAISTYRSLLDRWKAAGRTGAKQDDALWAQFKAAGDALYSARKAERAREDEEDAANLVLKRELLAQAEKLLPVSDPKAARKALTAIQIKWDEIGRVPRANVHEIEDGIRKVERAVTSAEREQWRASDPSTKERVSDMSSQLHAAIAELEAKVEAARASGDSRALADAESALTARKEWLAAISR